MSDADAAAAAGPAGKVALVTGASSGIGRAAALALAAAGARVVAAGQNPERTAQIAAETGGRAVTADLSHPEGCAQAIAAARAEGPLQILVAAAGLGGYLDRPIFEQRWDAWRESLAVMLDAPFLLAQAAACDMRDHGWGRIVLVGSTAGQIGAPAMSAYCAAKHGLLGLMRSVAQDVAPFRSTCNAILPSWVRTPMAEADAAAEAARRGLQPAQIWAERAAANPSGRLVTAEDCADLILFLCGRQAAAINGEAITVSLGSPW